MCWGHHERYSDCLKYGDFGYMYVTVDCRQVRQLTDKGFLAELVERLGALRNVALSVRRGQGLEILLELLDGITGVLALHDGDRGLLLDIEHKAVCLDDGDGGMAHRHSEIVCKLVRGWQGEHSWVELRLTCLTLDDLADLIHGKDRDEIEREPLLGRLALVRSVALFLRAVEGSLVGL